MTERGRGEEAGEREERTSKGKGRGNKKTEVTTVIKFKHKGHERNIFINKQLRPCENFHKIFSTYFLN